MRPCRRALPSLCALALAGALAVAAGPARPDAAGADPAADEARLAAIVNYARVSSGLPPLAVDAATSVHARGWSGHMGFHHTLFHDPKLPAIAAAGAWSSQAAENVGWGSDVDTIAGAFWASPTHRANILGPWDHMAIGVTPVGGRNWVTIYFLHR